MNQANLHQICRTLERTEFRLRSPFQLPVRDLMVDLGLGTADHCYALIRLCESKCLIEIDIDRGNYTAYVKCLTPLGNNVLEVLKTRLWEFEDPQQSIELQLDRAIQASEQQN